MEIDNRTECAKCALIEATAEHNSRIHDEQVVLCAKGMIECGFISAKDFK